MANENGTNGADNGRARREIERLAAMLAESIWLAKEAGAVQDRVEGLGAFFDDSTCQALWSHGDAHRRCSTDDRWEEVGREAVEAVVGDTLEVYAMLGSIRVTIGNCSESEAAFGGEDNPVAERVARIEREVEGLITDLGGLLRGLPIEAPHYRSGALVAVVS